MAWRWLICPSFSSSGAASSVCGGGDCPGCGSLEPLISPENFFGGLDCGGGEGAWPFWPFPAELILGLVSLSFFPVSPGVGVGVAPSPSPSPFWSAGVGLLDAEGEGDGEP